MRRWLPGLLALALCASAARADSSWIQIRSDHFTVLTDAGEKRGREVAERFEQMRSIFGSLILHDRVNIPVPLEIIGFRNTKEFRQFAPLWHGKPVELAGLFQMGEDRDFILLDLSSPDPYQTVFHEYAHLLLNGNYPPTQPWFDEGFAEYFSTITIENKKVKIGTPPEGETEVISQSGLEPVLKLFAVRHNSPDYNEGNRRSLFYAESWLAVHYFFDHRLLGEIGKYFDLVENQHAEIPQAIEQAFGMDARHFDRVLQQYFNGGRVSLMLAPAPEESSFTYTAAKLKDADAQAILADAHLHSPDYHAKAVEEFEQILAHDPGNEAAERGLGYACLYQQDFAGAAQHFRQAVRLNSGDARVLYYSALLSYRQAGARGTEPEDLGEMASDLHRSLQLDPSFADAYGLLAIVEAQQGSPSEALATITRALQMRPRDEHFMLNYAHILLLARKADDAQAVFAKLESSDDPAIAAQARSILGQLESNRERRVMASPPAAQPAVTAVAAASAAENAAASAEPSAVAPARAVSTAAPPKPDARPILFLKGKLLAVDCSAAPAAMATVISAGRKWQLRAADPAQVVVLGADEFSCGWKDRNVAINYRKSGAAAGDLVSIEIQ